MSEQLTCYGEVRTGEVIDIKGELATVAGKVGVDLGLANKLAEAFVPLAEQAASVIGESAGITVTDATQVTEIKASRAARLKLRAIRCEIEDVRKGLKEEWLRPGQAIDQLARYLKERIEPVEKRLEDQEKFAERKEAERKAALRASREKLLAPFGVNTTFYQLADMDEKTFAELLNSSRLAHEAKLAEAKRIEEERVAAEAARREEEARVRAENDRLRKEAEEREAAARAEREAAEAERRAAEAQARRDREEAEAKLREERRAAEEKAAAERAAHEAVLKKEREAREQLERDAAARKAEDKRKAAAESKAKRAAERAPDRAKIEAIAAAVSAIPMPAVNSTEAIAVVANVRAKAEAFATWIKAQAETLA